MGSNGILRVVRLGVLVTVILSLFILPAAASVFAGGATSYDGVDDMDDEAIEVETTISPDNEEIVDVELFFRGTDQTFIDTDSFDLEISPGDADIDIGTVGEGDFEINRIGPNEEVTFSFEVYPRTISQENIDAAEVLIEYTQSGQQLSDSQTLEADLSNSAAFEIDRLQLWGDVIGMGNILSYILNVVFLGTAGILLYKEITSGGTTGDRR